MFMQRESIDLKACDQREMSENKNHISLKYF